MLHEILNALQVLRLIVLMLAGDLLEPYWEPALVIVSSNLYSARSTRRFLEPVRIGS